MDYPRIGKLVTYKNKDYVVVSEDFDCGGNLHVLGMVKVDKWHRRFLRVIYIEEKEGNVTVKPE
jgi:hypothetical protein